MREFSVGQKVSVYAPYNGGVVAVTEIASVSARKIKCANGAEFTIDGKAWGAGDAYGSNLIHPWKPEDDENLARKKALSAIRRIEWHDLPTETLNAVLGLLKSNDYRPRGA